MPIAPPRAPQSKAHHRARPHRGPEAEAPGRFRRQRVPEGPKTPAAAQRECVKACWRVRPKTPKDAKNSYYEVAGACATFTRDTATPRPFPQATQKQALQRA